MDLKSLIIVLNILLFPAAVGAQKHELIAGWGYFNEYHLAGYKSGDSTINRAFGLSFSFMLRVLEERYWENSLTGKPKFFKGALHQQGPGIGLHYRWGSKKNERKYSQITLEYRRLRSGKYISDEGRSAGTNMSYYAEFYESYNNVAFLFERKKKLEGLDNIQFYWNIGPIIRAVRRDYIVSGAARFPQPSSGVSHEVRYFFVFRLGFDFRIMHR